jgi:ATP diphosphatase
MLNEQASISKLRWIMSELRDPKTGCPWDIKQTFETITNHTLEEAYEVVDAIEQGDFVELEKELGDLLFQVIFYSQLGQEQAYFNFDSVVNAVCEKLIRRHPHVFADAKLQSDAEIKANWENEKILERAIKNQQLEKNIQYSPLSILADIPKNLPALSQAAKIQKRCAHVGFDWDNKFDVFAKIEEEVQEVKEELEKSPIDKNNLAEELGDLMFAVVNLCRHAKEDPETLLRKANAKFSRRFRAVEAHVNDSGKALGEHDLKTLEHFWQRVKQQEKKG